MKVKNNSNLIKKNQSKQVFEIGKAIFERADKQDR